jgi:heme A synthase
MVLKVLKFISILKSSRQSIMKKLKQVDDPQLASHLFLGFLLFIHLFLYVYVVWTISAPCPLPLSSPSPPPWLLGRTCSVLFSSFVEEET